jgi:diamine N-acetyltransferase
MPAIELREITHENFDPVLELAVAAEQARFIPPVVYALAQAYVYAPHLWPLAAYDADQPVGFVMYGHQVSRARWAIAHLTVDASYQGRGYGRAIMQAVIALMLERHGCNEIFTSYVNGNDVAHGLYETLGFRTTGEVKETETYIETFMMLTIADGR